MKVPFVKKEVSCDCIKNCRGCDCINGFTEELQKSKTSLWLFAICCFLFGIVLGFIFAPKKSFSVGCNNSAVTYEAEEEKDKKCKCKKKKNKK